jgi:hypothetical protein
MADGFQDHVCALTVGELHDLGDPFIAAFGDDMGGAEVATEVGVAVWRPIRMIMSAPSCLDTSTPERPTAPSPMTTTVVSGPTPP